MWKEFLYFSKGQKTGVIVLICLIVIGLGACYLLPFFFTAEVPENDSRFMAETEAFRKSLISRDSLREAQWQQKEAEWRKKYEEKYHQSWSNTSFQSNYREKTSAILSTFDPNTADSSALVRLGLKPRIAHNILKYRKAGGYFKTPDDFAKVYGISPEKFKELESYICIAAPTKKEIKINNGKRDDLIVELNSADTTELMQVKGIGRGYARGIVRFRQQTGGFISVEQLSEIYGMRKEALEKIRPYCRIDASLIKKIKINTASEPRLRSHPYLGFYKAKAIYELRRKKGKLYSINDLNQLEELSPEDIKKIEPYLSFE